MEVNEGKQSESEEGSRLGDLYTHVNSANPARPLLCPSPIAIGPGLVLRRAELSDGPALSAFNARIHFPSAGRSTNEIFTATSHAHPLLDPSCFTVIVNTDKNEIVSSVYSVPQVWFYSFADVRVPFLVTRPEAVGTDPEYRAQGFVKKHFDVHHEWAESLGAPLQFIGGMPLYYTRFGYDASPHRNAGVSGTYATISSIVAAKSPNFRFRLATVSDAEFLENVTRSACALRDEIWTDLNKEYWRNVIASRSAGNFTKYSLWILEHTDSLETEEQVFSAVGFVKINAFGGAVKRFELASDTDISWTEATKALLSWLPEFFLNHYPEYKAAISAAYVNESESSAPNVAEPTIDTKVTELDANWKFSLKFGKSHPAYTSVISSVLPIVEPPYYWYTRIGNQIQFLNQILPVLNARLKSSVLYARYNGVVILAKNYNNGTNAAILSVEKGVVVSVTTPSDVTIKTEQKNPEQVFVALGKTSLERMVLGFRTCSELLELNEVMASTYSAKFLDILFPRMRNDYISGLD
ncbi:hypothetical protein HK100_006812 [Physocladia obscura]|uniref:Uncharacterized protein n=1 Tax=Physocladia obscura TaxID=109957 RepID=A0AAD5T637_9FUNG|nr:hypothetical protein HK100_006812 [Physocladia obscura]